MTQIITRRARQWKGMIAIQFPFKVEDVVNVKTLEGRRYHPEGKYWTAISCKGNIEKLDEWNFNLDQELQSILKDEPVELEPIPQIKVEGLKKKLLPFQEEGVSFIVHKKGRALIGDEMGLGKTIQSLSYLQLYPQKRPVIIVTPASLKLNWQKEINDCLSTKESIQILEGKTPYELTGTIIIINYDILSNWVEALQSISPQIIITDEGHYYKANSALRTKAVKRLSKGVPHFLVLTGTPIENRPVEIYNAIKIIDPYLFPNYWHFVKRYCGAKNNGWGWDFNGATNTEELHEILTRNVMIRRLKKDVLKELPDKVKSFTPMILKNREEYDKVEEQFFDYVEEVKGKEAAEKASNAAIIAQIEYLKQAAVKGKMDSILQWISDFLSTGEKLVVFAIHRFAIDSIMERFAKIAVKIDGSVSQIKRNEAVQRFQNDKDVSLFVGNIKAAGVGLTLTASSNVAFIELPWTPGELAQAEDRCHRIGQKDMVNVHYLLAENTIEEEIATLLDKKKKVLDAVLDGKETEQESLLSALMDSYQRKIKV